MNNPQSFLTPRPKPVNWDKWRVQQAIRIQQQPNTSGSRSLGGLKQNLNVVKPGSGPLKRIA